MKSIISAAAFLAILSTPALANKTRIDPPESCDDRILVWQIVYHLDQIEMALDEMRKNVLSVPLKPRDPVENLE
jgi:hypothetical protein